MQLHFLGTGAGMPSKERNTSALMMKLLDERGTMWLFDCGEATQHQILHTTLKPRKIEKIFITHLHGDHIYGLPGLLGSRSFQGGDELLTIYGPKGLQDWVEMTLAVSKTHLTYPIAFVEVNEGVIFEDDQFIVMAQPLQHVVPCFGYRVVQKELPGELLVEEAIRKGVPKGPMLGHLKRGEDVELANGTIVRSVDVMGPKQPGFTVTILGDTRFCNEAIELATGADIVVHEATFDHATTNLATKYGHATNVEAARVAKLSGAKYLILNHISARFLVHDLKMLEEEARSLFNQVSIANDHSVYSLKQGIVIKE